MTRLFDPRDIEFLRAAPGFTERAEAVFRRQRCRILHGHLLILRAEFLQTLGDLETVEDDPAEDGPVGRLDLAFPRLRYRVQFGAAMLRAYGRLFRFRWRVGSAVLRDVVQPFDTIRAGMCRSIPAVSRAAVEFARPAIHKVARRASSA